MYPNQAGGQERSNPPPPPNWPYPPPPSASLAVNSSQPPNGAHPIVYPPPTTLPPLSEHHRDMAMPSYQHPPPPPSAPVPASYQYPPPSSMAPYNRPPDSRYAAHPHPYPPQHQPAPRQRTAIACRYCRRRKIRCSGFDSSEDGRCVNCARFSQECVFTPVSAQTQAFVPAHAVYNRGGPQPTQLYGAYGQPLPPQVAHDPYARPPTHYTLPSPTGPYSAAPPPPPTGYPAPYDDRNAVNGTARKRPANEPHTPTLPPPNPAASSALPRTMAHDYRYPDPSAPPVEMNPEAAAPQPGHPYYAQQPQRRSPTLASPYPSASEPSRSSSSPHTATASSTPGTTSYSYPPEPGLQPPQSALAIRTDGRTPPPSASTPGSGAASATAATTNGHQQGPGRPSMSISSIVSGDGSSPGARSNTDNAMLKKLGTTK